MNGDKDRSEPDDRTPDKPANVAPDAVKDPNEKTEGLPGLGPKGAVMPDDETDPGGS